MKRDDATRDKFAPAAHPAQAAHAANEAAAREAREHHDAKAARRGKPSALIDDPLWYKDAIIYQVHVKSFFDSNNDGVGDFPGLLAKLDYIAGLGVTAIWLLPFYPSPRRDDGYDIADYRNVHPDYGQLADVRRFIQEAHARGIRVITELVINHTSDQHPWFQRARRAKPGSNHRNYYVWSDTDTKYAGTRIIFIDTEPSNWTHDPVAGAYYWHRFYSHQPDLNFDNPAVMREVLQVMRFWLDMGIDGLRLDAVPYLVEREGTNNENLPETHAILKQIRATIDAHYPNRMLLAEANQWPEDVQEYFGREDECQMAFNFPLMPRIYMAIASEDRFPIIDIMKQTPDLPPSCQWAIFLRNHDELTLEMVTDSERDYLWNTYASDRRARLNLGIRRRLAPLMERDRRRIELINSLLLSMPGTPVIYYGDELGMGDNIHLGDRDGVRTPMQWSSDRNGGFSRADPEQLVLPPLMGSLYGYDAINVEAQSRDPHSLLNWTRRMLATRRSKQAFGRGTIRFLRPENRKVLAYLREMPGENPILCVANLSRGPQAVELDLSEFAGHSPVEMTADSVFPAIGQLPYLLTFPPYGFLWFLLCSGGQRPTWGQPASEQLPEFVTVVIREGQTGATPENVRLLESEVLPSWLSRRRWFASKDRPLKRVRLAALTTIPGAGFAFTEIEAELDDGATERYVLPIAITWGTDTTTPLHIQLALARVRRGRTIGHLTDAFSLPLFAYGVLGKLRERAAVPTVQQSTIHFDPTPLFAELDLGDAPEIRWLAAEQSNSSLIVADTLVLKLVRRLMGGVHPEAEMSRYLTQLGYPNTAPLYGEVVRVDPAGVPHTLAILQGYIDNQGNAWDWALDYLRRTVDELALAVDGGTDSPPDPAIEEEAVHGYCSIVGTIGRRLGELHAALASPTDDPAFAPEPASPEHVRAWVADAKMMLVEALDLLQQHVTSGAHTLDDDALELARSLLTRRDALLAAMDERVPDHAAATRIRIHGDFHLGQVLLAQGDAYLIDFEGEPARPLDYRRAKTCTLRDVAGLLRSLSYAGAAAQSTTENAPQQTADRKRTLFERFRGYAVEAFLTQYRAAVASTPQPLVGAKHEQALLDLFLIEKAAYEIRYEAANRPTWLALPVRGLAAIASRVLGTTTGLPPHDTHAGGDHG
ncbi:maltose alpha-D-glucosyltransferase [Paraburkholderia caballeronis]|uniref:Maltokinase n=1 Tax=Paraburkholderia caballeronis TaxID=416943 RepID=A0A1H7KWT2_9BURK|nr:maltose alpha-D-glucosyltransferase [Paraburkholderia caballeronis]PXW28174.1 trehalose synthase [Paraburkholderia caballeronis]PXX03540.1 trehalose synthase [Paraburkholderia caballeronis]RAK04284.1 trehalose synthase [Paraburkholderia caballeronis]SED86338.1 trehalose synthase [Paraburkholderia caballeronis]SEK90555.1 trehalose synthase [Paraburkholderia caballeronis]